jgi:cell division protein FtsB
MVDLYGYTGMLLAATQSQQRQIKALKAEVEVLSREVERISRRGRHPGTSMRR